MRMTGTQDHVWTIEQTPNNGGYRIYQSYNDAYSLNAWLASDISQMFANGDITEPSVLKKTVGDGVVSWSGGAATIDNLTKLPDSLKPLIPYVEFVRDYKQAAVLVNFEKAWNAYGKGMLLTWEKFQTYLENLKTLANYFSVNDTTTNPFSQDIFNLWINMFSAPDPIYFPNYPNNFLSSMLLVGKTFRFEILEVSLPAATPCRSNAMVFATNGFSLFYSVFAFLFIFMIVIA